MVIATGCAGSQAVDTGAETSSSPAPAVTVDEGSTAEQFWDRVVELPYYDTVTLLPAIGEVEALVGRSEAIVEGAIREIEIVTDEWKPSPDYPLAAGRVRLLVHVDGDELLVGDDQVVRDDFVWEIPAWTGDPALAADAKDDIAAQFADAPIGARVLLFCEPASDSRTTWWVSTGALQDEASTVKVDFGRRTAVVPDSFATVDVLAAQVDSALR